MPVYYVTLFGDRIAGPFDTKAEARRLADEENTAEIGQNYAVERAEAPADSDA